MPRRFQFSLQWLLVFVAGTMTGGQTARAMALAERPMRGGVPVSWSVRGEVTFFSIGCLAAIAGMSVVAAAPTALRIRSPWRGPKRIRRLCILILAAVMIGAMSAAYALFTLALVFFAMPREIFDFLTTRQ